MRDGHFLFEYCGDIKISCSYGVEGSCSLLNKLYTCDIHEIACSVGSLDSLILEYKWHHLLSARALVSAMKGSFVPCWSGESSRRVAFPGYSG